MNETASALAPIVDHEQSYPDWLSRETTSLPVVKRAPVDPHHGAGGLCIWLTSHGYSNIIEVAEHLQTRLKRPGSEVELLSEQATLLSWDPPAANISRSDLIARLIQAAAVKVEKGNLVVVSCRIIDQREQALAELRIQQMVKVFLRHTDLDNEPVELPVIYRCIVDGAIVERRIYPGQTVPPDRPDLIVESGICGAASLADSILDSLMRSGWLEYSTVGGRLF